MNPNSSSQQQQQAAVPVTSSPSSTLPIASLPNNHLSGLVSLAGSSSGLGSGYWNHIKQINPAYSSRVKLEYFYLAETHDGLLITEKFIYDKELYAIFICDYIINSNPSSLEQEIAAYLKVEVGRVLCLYISLRYVHYNFKNVDDKKEFNKLHDHMLAICHCCNAISAKKTMLQCSKCRSVHCKGHYIPWDKELGGVDYTTSQLLCFQLTKQSPQLGYIKIRSALLGGQWLLADKLQKQLEILNQCATVEVVSCKKCRNSISISELQPRPSNPENNSASSQIKHMLDLYSIYRFSISPSGGNVDEELSVGKRVLIKKRPQKMTGSLLKLPNNSFNGYLVFLDHQFEVLPRTATDFDELFKDKLPRIEFIPTNGSPPVEVFSGADNQNCDLLVCDVCWLPERSAKIFVCECGFKQCFCHLIPWKNASKTPSTETTSNFEQLIKREFPHVDYTQTLALLHYHALNKTKRWQYIPRAAELLESRSHKLCLRCHKTLSISLINDMFNSLLTESNNVHNKETAVIKNIVEAEDHEARSTEPATTEDAGNASQKSPADKKSFQFFNLFSKQTKKPRESVTVNEVNSFNSKNESSSSPELKHEPSNKFLSLFSKQKNNTSNENGNSANSPPASPIQVPAPQQEESPPSKLSAKPTIDVFNPSTGIIQPMDFTGTVDIMEVLKIAQFSLDNISELSVYVQSCDGEQWSIPLDDAFESHIFEDESSRKSYLVAVRSVKDNIGPKLPIKYLSESVKFNASLKAKIDNKLTPLFGGSQSIRGDGNCYYRAIYLGCISQMLMSDFRKTLLLHLKSVMMTVQYDSSISTDNHASFIRLLDDAIGGNRWNSIIEFEKDVLNSSSYTLDATLVRACRRLVSMFLLQYRNESFNGLTLEETIIFSCNTSSLEDYCKDTIDRMGIDAEGPIVDLGILFKILGCKGCIVLLDRRENVPISIRKPSVFLDALLPDYLSYLQPVYILLQPGHYDLLFSNNSKSYDDFSEAMFRD